MPVLARLRRELVFAREAAKMLRATRSVSPADPTTVADLLERRADRTPDREALLFEGRSYSYAEVDRATNRVAHWARFRGIGRGGVVALLMENRPEFLFTWLGLAKIGAVTALLNTNLRGQALAHGIRVAAPDVVLAGAELAEALDTARPHLEAIPEVWVSGAKAPLAGANDLDARLAIESDARPRRELRDGMTAASNLFYIYTSGTTGNPKAARFSHARFLQVTRGFIAAARIRANDRILCVLPLFHTAGGVVTVGMALGTGATLVLRRKFSASAFWRECREQRVTVFQYIGELCRYMLHVPPGPDDRSHAVRLAVGNGLRPDVWKPFAERFGVGRILEFYGATEGNVALMNLEGTVGAVGRIPEWARRRTPVRLVRFDVEREEHVRSDDGFFVECEPGEVGEALGEIPADPRAPLGRFEGYTAEDDTRKKVLRNVFREGDAWFRSGDLLRRDADGTIYFVDRIGDTFRWKGENVATTEVAEVLSTLRGVREATVYGVAVADHEGRAGMAALVVDDRFDPDAFYGEIERQLPVYARPLFVRISGSIEVTGTFKHRKVDLVREGFDPRRIDDPVWFRDDQAGKFVALDCAVFDRISSGQVRL